MANNTHCKLQPWNYFLSPLILVLLLTFKVFPGSKMACIYSFVENFERQIMADF